MTQRMSSYTPYLNIQVIAEGWQLPRPSESMILNIPKQCAWVRHITMNHEHTPWIAARSVMPQAICQQSGGRLQQLGTQPLGTLLFSDPTTNRHQLEWAQIKPLHHDYHWIQSIAPNPTPYFWSRRSIIVWQHHPMIVIEYFLPALLRDTQKMGLNKKNETYVDSTQAK